MSTTVAELKKQLAISKFSGHFECLLPIFIVSCILYGLSSSCMPLLCVD